LSRSFAWASRSTQPGYPPLRTPIAGRALGPQSCLRCRFKRPRRPFKPRPTRIAIPSCHDLHGCNGWGRQNACSRWHTRGIPSMGAQHEDGMAVAIGRRRPKNRIRKPTLTVRPDCLSLI
jgi:hypothetical protein